MIKDQVIPSPQQIAGFKGGLWLIERASGKGITVALYETQDAIRDFDLAGIDIVVNTHLHADHRGGNHLFAGRPIYVQRRELDDARSEDDYTIRDWVDAPGVRSCRRGRRNGRTPGSC